MSLRVSTARLQAPVPRDGLDVTRKSGGAAGLPFAPSWLILSPALAARERADAARASHCDDEADAIEAAAWDVYAPKYLLEMRRSYATNRPAWDALLARESVTLLCYCTSSTRCHRFLLAGILAKLGATVVGEVARPPGEAATQGLLQLGLEIASKGRSER